MTEYITVPEAAEKWNITERQVQNMCKSGKLEAVKEGKCWMIPSSAKRPADGRIKDGSYVGWRKRSREKDEHKDEGISFANSYRDIE